jgi:hypothetical protein
VRIFLDANILFSAADPLSATRRLFTAAQKYAELVTSQHAYAEAFQNLTNKRVEHVVGLQELEKHIEVSKSFYQIQTSELPDHDIPILAGAIGAGCSHLWTSDKRHFGKWYGTTLQGIAIMSNTLLAEALMKSGWRP